MGHDTQDWNEADMKHPNYDSSEALAYGWMQISLYFGAAVLIWLSYAWVFNQILVLGINPDIAAGRLSLQTVNAVEFNINVMRYAPPIILILGFCWAVNRAIFKRSTG